MRTLILALAGLTIAVYLVCLVNEVVERIERRQRARMGVGCWLYRIGVIR